MQRFFEAGTYKKSQIKVKLTVLILATLLQFLLRLHLYFIFANKYIIKYLQMEQFRRMYRVESSSEPRVHYTVYLIGWSPVCTCPDWHINEMPCKHLFALLRLGFIGWNDVPEQFRYV